jgi:hypothetical protein
MGLRVVIVLHHGVFLSEYNDLAAHIGESIYVSQVLLTAYDAFSLVFTVVAVGAAWRRGSFAYTQRANYIPLDSNT